MPFQRKKLRRKGDDSGGGGSGGATKISWGVEQEGYAGFGAEVVLWQWLWDFDDIGPLPQARMTGWAKVVDGVETYNLRVGGTRSLADGTVHATFSTGAVAYTQLTNLGAVFANAGGPQIVKLCLATDGSGQTNRGYIQGVTFTIG